MPEPISQISAQRLRDRHSLLWVCQKFDLIPGADSHEYDLPLEAAVARYRLEVSKTDETIATSYWEAIWLEGGRSPILSAARAQAATSSRPRQIVTLAGPADSNAHVPAEQFLAVSVLPGLIDKETAADARYGAQKGRARERVAWDLAQRLQMYRGRVLVVIGANEEGDLDRLYEVLEDSPVADIRVILIWPEGSVDPPLPGNGAVEVETWRGTPEQFMTLLELDGIPKATDATTDAVRVGRKIVTIRPEELYQTTRHFALIWEKDFAAPERFTLDDLQAFLSGDLSTWHGYVVGADAPRAYVSGHRKSYLEEAKELIEQVVGREHGSMVAVLKLPAEPGAGATTLLRQTAFALARLGNPTLLLKPDQVDFDKEAITSFGVALSEASARQGVEDLPPLVIAFDAQHGRIPTIGQLPQVLASHSRRAVILQIVGESSSGVETRGKNITQLLTLQSVTSEEEARSVHARLQAVVAQWHLPLDLPPLDRWLEYQALARYESPDNSGAVRTLFWVALRFYLLEAAELTSRDSLADVLGEWIDKRLPSGSESPLSQFVLCVAVLSFFKMVCPLWPAVRPITGGTFSPELMKLINALQGIVIWGDYLDEMDDQTLRFAHPALAEEFLRRRGLRNPANMIDVISPMLAGLSAGHQADIWIAETLAVGVFAPNREERQFTDWDWRLDAFTRIPPLLREQSKAILHHWARTLYLSVAYDARSELFWSEKAARFDTAIAKLQRAIELPRRDGRDEVPSHLYNTLATAYTRYAALREADDRTHAQELWAKACIAFELSIESGAGGNIEAMLAYSHRLLIHAETSAGSRTVQQSDEVARALTYLDSVEELITQLAVPDPDWEADVQTTKAKALTLLSDEIGAAYVSHLKDTSPELGYYCEARLALAPASQRSVEAALQILNNAEANGVRLTARSLQLRLAVMRKHPILKYDFPNLLRNYEALESNIGKALSPVDMFRLAVACYQTDRFAEGAERFRRLREYARRSDSLVPRLRDRWRDQADPRIARLTNVRVTRVNNEWRGEGYVEDLKQYVPLRPRHFSPLPAENQNVPCAIRFEMNGPLAVPTRFEESAELARK